MTEIWRVTQPEYGFTAPPPNSISQLVSRFSVQQDSVLYCSETNTTAMRETLQIFYNRKNASETKVPIAWRKKHALLKGKLIFVHGEIIDIETASVQRELDLFLGGLLDKHTIPYIDTGVLRGNCLEITQAVSHWAFHKKKAAGIIFRSKFESNGVCYAFYNSRIKIELLEIQPLENRFETYNSVCQEYRLKL